MFWLSFGLQVLILIELLPFLENLSLFWAFFLPWLLLLFFFFKGFWMPFFLYCICLINFIITGTCLTILIKHRKHEAEMKIEFKKQNKTFFQNRIIKSERKPSYTVSQMKPSSKTAKYQSGNCIMKSSEQLGPLVLGDCNSAMDKKIHKQYNIRTVISIGQQAMPLKEKLPQNSKHYFYDVHDNKSQKVPCELFDEISKIIQERRREGGVLVHCYAGVSRSSTFVIAYIMQRWNKSYESAKQQVKLARSCIYPNDGFVNHLKNYEKVLQRRQQQRLKRLQQEKRLQIQKSLVKSSRKSVRGGVRSADMSPQRVKQMDEQRKKHMHEIILQPIPVIREQQQEAGEKEQKTNEKQLQNPFKNNHQSSMQKRKVQLSKPNPKLGLPVRQIVLKNQIKKQQMKLPNITHSPYRQHIKQTLNKLIRQNQNLHKNKPLDQGNHKKPKQNQKKQTTLKVSSSFRKPQIKKQPVTHQQQRSVLRESKSVMSTTKYKTTAFDIDETQLNQHLKKVKKIYQHKVNVK